MDNPRQGINMGRSRGRMAATQGRNDVQRPGLTNNPNYSGTLTDESQVTGQLENLNVVRNIDLFFEEIFRDETPNIIPGKKSFARSRIAEFQQELIPESISPVPNDALGAVENESVYYSDHSLSVSSRKSVAAGPVATEEIIAIRPQPFHDKHGTNGRSIALQANFFRLCDNKGWIVYEYLVEFIPPKETICSRKSCLKVHKERLGSFIYNGTVLYSTRLYPEESLMLESRRPKDNALLTIRLTLLRQVPIDDALSARICTELLHKCLSSLKMQIIGPNYYNPEKAFNVTEDRSNLEVWPGYMMKIEPCENDLLLCIELTHKVIRCETMLDMLAIFRSRGIVGQYLQNSVRGMVVRTSYNNRCYRITGIDLDSTPYSTFKLPDGRLMSFIEFYQEKYELNIKHYEQPMLVSTFKCSSMGIEETVYLVPELCCITGLALDRIDMFLMRALSEKTNFKPQEHLEKVARFCDTLIKCTPAAEIFRKWGMDLVCEPVQFEGRVLTNEQVSVGSNSGQPSKVEFIGTDLTTFPMWVGLSLKSWIVVYPEEMEMDVRNFLTMLKKCASMLGMELSPPHMEEMPDDNAVTYSQHLDKVIALNMKPQIIVCVTNVNREDRYRAIKIKCCVENAVLSQVITKRSMEMSWKTSPIARRLLTQINAKIGGVPWCVDIPLKGLMTVGIDVATNPMGKGVKFFALVASMSNNFSRVFSGSQPYGSDEELKYKICEQLSLALESYCKHNNGSLPLFIVVYRDGIPKKCRDVIPSLEVACMQQMLSNVYQGDTWKFAYIFLTKHSGARIFSRNGHNPPIGTVVDKCITRMNQYDFYLITAPIQSHTSFPTLYNVVWDNTGLNADKMQRLAYKLTHLYFNVKSTVRTPAPVRYAQRLVQLVCNHLKRPPNPDLSDCLYFL